MTTSPTLLGLVLVWSQQSYLRLLLIMRYYISSLPTAVTPATLPRGKLGKKWMIYGCVATAFTVSYFAIDCGFIYF